MPTVDVITALFSEGAEPRPALPPPPEAPLWPRAMVTLGWRLALGDAGRSAVVAPPPRAPPALASREDPAQLAAGLLGRSDRAGGP